MLPPSLTSKKIKAMIQIVTPEKAKDNPSIQRFIEMSISHELIINNEQSEPVVIEGKKKYQGEAEIHQFLDDYKNFMNEWYACHCDVNLDT